MDNLQCIVQKVFTLHPVPFFYNFLLGLTAGNFTWQIQSDADLNFFFRVLSHIRADRIQTFVGKCLEKKMCSHPKMSVSLALRRIQKK